MDVREVVEERNVPSVGIAIIPHPLDVVKGQYSPADCIGGTKGSASPPDLTPAGFLVRACLSARAHIQFLAPAGGSQLIAPEGAYKISLLCSELHKRGHFV